jgi:DNA-binding response OmpR family regulator
MTELPSTALKVLIVDDDPDGRALILHVLSGAGYDCLQAPDAETGMRLLGAQPVDVLVTDINLPGMSGLRLLSWVRGQSMACEVVIITAYPHVETAIEALRAGAADYLTRPVSNSALLEALDRVARRLHAARENEEVLVMLQEGLKRMTNRSSTRPGATSVAEAADTRQYRLGPVQLDLDRYLVEVSGQRVDATPSELEILHVLFRNAGRVTTAQELIQSVRGYRVNQREAPEIVRPHISNLRRKLVALEPRADIIQTVRGVGYMLKYGS